MNYSPQHPPANLGRYGCDACKAPLKRVRNQGCMSRHLDCKKRCNKDGWGSMCKTREAQ